MRTTELLEVILNQGIEAYLSEHAEQIENLGKPLIIATSPKSLMINCYFDDVGKAVPIFEFEDNGRIEQFDSFQDAFNAFIGSGRND